MAENTYLLAELIVLLFVKHVQITFGQENICELPKKQGTCNARIERWFFDINQGKCRKFLYSGCDGNQNSFKTKNDCEKACSDSVCRLPKNTGQCNLSQTRWYYDINAMTCKQFIYTGCQGNQNRFSIEKKCKQRCDGVKIDPCPPIPPCARPPPDMCFRATFSIYSGVKCLTGCAYSPCKPGSCPTTLTQPSNCTRCMSSTEECIGSLICCQGCCTIPVLDQKPGRCPTTGLKKCVGYTPECSLDSECPGERKCCLINNAKCCVDPGV